MTRLENRNEKAKIITADDMPEASTHDVVLGKTKRNEKIDDDPDDDNNGGDEEYTNVKSRSAMISTVLFDEYKKFVLQKAQ